MEIINKLITKTKHSIRYEQSNAWKHAFWVALFILFLCKNVSVQILVNTPPTHFEATKAAVDKFPNALPTATAQPPTQKSSVLPKEDNFSNLGFLLNPTFARRHNIAPALVAAKRRIVDDYVTRFAPTAQAEMQHYGVPASITLAQALLESDAGKSKLALKNYNHFGIKCFSKNCQKGHCTNFSDDSHKDFFRVYPNAWESFRAHSLFLKQPRYKMLFQLKPTDYKAWAVGLQQAGYATDPRYAAKIVALIEVLRLDRYDAS